jgi:hypothetical protein
MSTSLCLVLPSRLADHSSVLNLRTERTSLTFALKTHDDVDAARVTSINGLRVVS